MKLLLLVLLSPTIVFSQYKLHIEVTDSTRHKGDTLFLAGSFNGWNPHDVSFRIVPDKTGSYVYENPSKPGMYEFKVTRGSWSNVEVTRTGNQIQNRFLRISGDTSIRIYVGGWDDDFPHQKKPVPSSASKNVKVTDTAFFIPQLDRRRRIWIYLPPGYATSGSSYPVLYMQDGQNLFDNATSGFGEWGVDEFLDSTIGSPKKQYIIVGIDNGPKRLTEYNPYDSKQFGMGEGDKYVDFLVQTLKPFIDQRYRTKPSKKNTAVAGSSMGGLISFYAVLKYADIFGAAGIFSPAFWTASGLDNDIKIKAKKIRSKLFFYAGGKESENMISDMRKVETQVKSLSKSKIVEVIDDDAHHNEAAWRKHFPEFYDWL